MNTCYVYILSSRNNRHFSIKAIADLKHGVRYHRLRIARRLKLKKVYQKVVLIEAYQGLSAAVERERELKEWGEPRLRQYISGRNPRWRPVSITGFLETLDSQGNWPRPKVV